MSSKESTVLFFARVSDRHLFSLLEFYREDILILEDLGFVVWPENRIAEAARSKADWCFAWWWATAFPVVAAYRARGRPVIVTGASDFVDPGASRSLQLLKLRLKRALTAQTVRRATANVVISDFEARLLPVSDRTRVTRIYPSIDTSYFTTGPKTEAPSLVTIAQINPSSIRRKGVDITIAAVQRLRREFPDLRLFVLGPITRDGARYLETLRKEVDFGGVEICGEVSRGLKKRILASAWGYCQPSISEGFGAAMVEAMACGTTPIVSSGGALPEVIGDAGVVLAERSADGMAAAVAELFVDGGRRAQLSAAARQRAVETYDRRRRSRELAAVLRRHGVLCDGTG